MKSSASDFPPAYMAFPCGNESPASGDLNIFTRARTRVPSRCGFPFYGEDNSIAAESVTPGLLWSWQFCSREVEQKARGSLPGRPIEFPMNFSIEVGCLLRDDHNQAVNITCP